MVLLSTCGTRGNCNVRRSEDGAIAYRVQPRIVQVPANRKPSLSGWAFITKADLAL
jgi:hypothetical protein